MYRYFRRTLPLDARPVLITYCTLSLFYRFSRASGRRTPAKAALLELKPPLSAMAFTFSSPAQVDGSDRLQSQLARAAHLTTCGSVDDVAELAEWIRSTASGPRLREAAVHAVGAIASRGGIFGERARPLLQLQDDISRISKLDRDMAARDAAFRTYQLIASCTAHLPAWTVDRARAPVRSPAAASITTPTTTTTTAVHSHQATPALSLVKAPAPSAWPPIESASSVIVPDEASAWPPIESASSVIAPDETLAAPSVSPVESSASYAPRPPKVTWGELLEQTATSDGTPAAKKARAPSTASQLGLRAEDEPLYNALCALRASQAAAERKGAFMIASNEVLANLAKARTTNGQRPRTSTQLLNVKGVGRSKVDTYGAAWLKAMAAHTLGNAAKAPSPTEQAPAATCDEAESASLSAEQCRAVRLVQAGSSVFLTGGAGTGKSYTLKTIIRSLRKMHGSEAVYVTASTGIAACHVGGTTVHSFAGIGHGKESAQELAERIRSKQIVTRRWVGCRALVIDEVSMIDGVLFDKLEAIARIVRGARSRPSTCDPADMPFGGIQLVLCGDFFQLPPVGAGFRFMFEADAWEAAELHPVNLTQVFRQREAGFISLLDQMRKAELTPFSIAQLRHHAQNPPAIFLSRHDEAHSSEPAVAGAIAVADARHSPDGAKTTAQADPSPAHAHKQSALSTRLFPNNDAADWQNERRLHDLASSPGGGTLLNWIAFDDGYAGHLTGCLAPVRLSLRIGAQVGEDRQPTRTLHASTPSKLRDHRHAALALCFFR